MSLFTSADGNAGIIAQSSDHPGGAGGWSGLHQVVATFSNVARVFNP